MTASIFLAILLAPASAQSLRANLPASALPTVRLAAPVLPASALAAPRPVLPVLPSLAVPALPAAAVLPALQAPAAAAVAAPAAHPAVAAVQAAARPALEALSAPSVSNAGAHAAGVSLEDALTGRRSASAVFAVPAAPANGALPTARSARAVESVSYARGVSSRHRGILDESLRRRKAAWFRALARVGVSLEGPVAPKLKVTAAEDLSSKVAAVVTGAAFTVSWTQGPTKAGAFRVVVPAKDPEPEIRRLADPAPADAKILYLRFHDADQPAIKAFLEERGLRVVRPAWNDQPWVVAVTGRDRASAVARRLNGTGPVLSATAKSASHAEDDQVLVAFRSAAAPADKARVLRTLGLSVLETRQDGLWRLGAAKGRGAKALAALQADPAVFHVRGVTGAAPEARRAVVSFKDASEDAVAAFLGARRLKVVEALDSKTFIVSGDADAAALAAGLAGDPAVASAVAVGSLADEAVEAAAKGTASMKGRPWSSTEYNYSWAMGYESLRRRGATAAQLKRYEELTAAAPIIGGSFNPWSGD